ncbi:hypothetical protein U1Q18_046916 [Sarracenia purpurea var. burkii]
MENSSPETSTDLSDLVRLFIERENRSGDGDDDEEEDEDRSESERKSKCLKVTLRGLLMGCSEDEEVKKRIVAEAEQAYRGMGNGSSPAFKRRLVFRLRQKGFDAGLCRSKWERIGRFSSGSHEYIDVNVAGIRYVVEICLAGEFEIARATDSFASLLASFPPIFVGKVEELKRVVRLMCRAIKDSMKTAEMPVPPWRRYEYMQAKWSCPYKRTTNEAPAPPKKAFDSDADSAKKRTAGAVVPTLPVISCHCREDFASKVGLRMGQLALAFNGTNSGF